MSNPFTDPLATDPTAPIVLAAATPRRVSKEQLAAAERARLYHINKLAAHRSEPPPQIDPLMAAPRTPNPESAGDASGAH